MTAWSVLLRNARRSVGLSQAEAAGRAGLSESSFKAYEGGRRDPSRPRLIAILDALDVNQTDRNAVLSAAGSPSRRIARGPSPDPQHAALARDRRDPSLPLACVRRQRAYEIVDANAAGRRLWRLDPTTPGVTHVERNALAFATDAEVASHVVNWEESVSR